MIATVFVTSAQADSRVCGLSFRWTSGKPIQTDVIHPTAEALQNKPFLNPAEITSAEQSTDAFGERLNVTLSPSSAEILKAETKAHVGSQLLIMFGDTVLVAPMVRSPVGASFEMRLPDSRILATVLDGLRRGKASDCGPVS